MGHGTIYDAPIKSQKMTKKHKWSKSHPSNESDKSVHKISNLSAVPLT